jgi:hypothetical protein
MHRKLEFQFSTFDRSSTIHQPIRKHTMTFDIVDSGLSIIAGCEAGKHRDGQDPAATFFFFFFFFFSWSLGSDDISHPHESSRTLCVNSSVRRRALVTALHHAGCDVVGVLE